MKPNVDTTMPVPWPPGPVYLLSVAFGTGGRIDTSVSYPAWKLLISVLSGPPPPVGVLFRWLALTAIEGSLLTRQIEIPGKPSGRSSVQVDHDTIRHQTQGGKGTVLFTFAEEIKCEPGRDLVLQT